MDAPDELRAAVAQVIRDALTQADYGHFGGRLGATHAADAVLRVPGIADALERDRKVAEIVRRWEGDPDVEFEHVLIDLAALYPEAGK